MNQGEFEQLVAETIEKTAEILVMKGREYAGGEDRLSNFKRAAANTGATPIQCCFIYLSKHYDSLATFVKDNAQGFNRPVSEPIEGRLDDLINYCLLMKGLVRENGNVPAQQDRRLEAAVGAGQTRTLHPR